MEKSVEMVRKLVGKEFGFVGKSGVWVVFGDLGWSFARSFGWFCAGFYTLIDGVFTLLFGSFAGFSHRSMTITNLFKKGR